VFTVRPHCSCGHGNSVCRSVRRSVRPSYAGIVPRRMKIGSCGLHCEVAKTLVFYQQWLGATSPSTKIGGAYLCGSGLFCAQSDLPTHAEKRRLRQISAYNVSNVRASEKAVIANRKTTTRLPTSYRGSAYVTPKSPQRVAQKVNLSFL